MHIVSEYSGDLCYTSEYSLQHAQLHWEHVAVWENEHQVLNWSLTKPKNHNSSYPDSVAFYNTQQTRWSFCSSCAPNWHKCHLNQASPSYHQVKLNVENCCRADSYMKEFIFTRDYYDRFAGCMLSRKAICENFDYVAIEWSAWVIVTVSWFWIFLIPCIICFYFINYLLLLLLLLLLLAFVSKFECVLIWCWMYYMYDI